MKYAAPLAIVLIFLFPSCATQPLASASGAPDSTQALEPAPGPQPAPSVTPIGAYRGAQHAASAVNTVRTLGSLF